MAREIITSNDVSGGLEAGRPTSREAGTPIAPDDYKDRLIKYIPAEIVAAFLAIQNIINAAQQSQVGLLFWGAFGVLLILTPIYLAKVQKVSKVTQLAISTIAFIVWVYALGGPFAGTPIHSPLAAAIVLILYTLVVSFIEPKS